MDKTKKKQENIKATLSKKILLTEITFRKVSRNSEILSNEIRFKK